METKSVTAAIRLIWTAFLWFLVIPSAPAAGRDGPDAKARHILQVTGVQGGLVVHVGCDGGKLTAALCAGEGYVVHGLDTDRNEVSKAREYIKGRKLYGRVSVEQLYSNSLPYADNLANLLVVEERGALTGAELMRVLAPLGVAYIKENGKWVKRVKSWPAEIDQWTHHLHCSGNNAVAMDRRIGPPGHMQWKSKPMWCRSHEFASSIHAMVSASGRIFSIIDEGVIGQPRGVPPQWTLVAQDAFNGVVLWKRPCDRSGRHSLVAVKDKVLVTLRSHAPLSLLDAATGKALLTCEQTGDVDEIVCCQGVVVVRSTDEKRQRRSGGEGQFLMALDLHNGETLWKKPVKRFVSVSLAAKNGRVCYHNHKELVSLDLETGEELWRTPTRGGRRGYTVMYKEVVFFTGGRIQAFSAATGKKLWEGPRARSGAGQPPGLFVANGLVWTAWASGHPRTFLWEPQKTVRKGYDPVTGEVRKTVSVNRLITPGHHIRCYPPKATDRYLLLNKRGVEFLDLEGNNHMRHNWLRAPCGHGAFPANGLLYMPPHQCFCYAGVRLNGFNALSAEGSYSERSGEAPQEARFVRGPAWGSAGEAASGSAEKDWPTYRHDPRRSGSTDCSVPVHLDKLWESSLGGKLSTPVAAGGRVFVAGVDAHTVFCLEGGSGKVLWEYTTFARVDSPPTVYRGLVLFGSTDGWVYCLRSTDGALVWRFRAAPARRRVAIFGQLESAWPVHGSVLVHKGVVYVTAGRSSYLDGGIWVYGLDPQTGKILHRRRLKSKRPDVTKYAGRPFDMEGVRSDILVLGEEDIYMSRKRFNLELTLKEMPRLTKLGDRKAGLHLAASEGFLDSTWFNRAYWIYSRRWPGYYFVYNSSKAGQLLVFDDTTTYGVQVFRKRHGHSPEFRPGSGYRLFADRNSNEPFLRLPDAGREKGLGYSRRQLPKWEKGVPVRVRAMVLAGKRLYIAGPPDLAGREEALASIRGRDGARFRVISASDGKKLEEYKLEKVPVFDGLIASNGKLYMATEEGTLICMGGK